MSVDAPQVLALFSDVIADRARYGAADLFLSAILTKKSGVSLFEGKLDSMEIAHEIKIGVLATKNGRWGGAVLEKAEKSALDRAVKAAVSASPFGDSDPDFSLAPPVSASIVGQTVRGEGEIGELESLSREMEEIALAAPAIRNVPQVGVSMREGSRVIANSAGLSLTQEFNLMTASLAVMALGADGRMVSVSDELVCRERENFDCRRFAESLREEALRRLSPKKVKSGTWPILFHPLTVGKLLSTMGPAWSGEALYRKMSRLEGRLGEQIAAPILSIADLPHSGLMPQGFDADGTPTQETFVIRDGVFESFLHNRYTAKKAGVESTGNASGGLGAWPGVMPTHLELSGSSVVSESAWRESMKSGIFVTEIDGASASPISGDFSYGASGYWIENGEIAYPIADFAIAGNFFDLLLSVDGVGAERRSMMMGGFSSIGARALLVRGLSVSGE